MTGCTAETARCEYWTAGAHYLRPPCCTGHLKQLLFFTHDLLQRHGILHWLDFGALLGAVRTGEFIPWDSDVDFGILRGDLDRVRSLEAEIARAGHCLDLSQPLIWRINFSPVNTQHIDLFPFWEANGWLKMRYPGASDEASAFPRHFLQELQPVELYGRRFPAPSPVREFLSTYRYGADFETPKRPEEIQGQESIAGKVRLFVARRLQLQEFQKNLVLLHDVLASTAFGDRYWVIGGLLIGWAREGRILSHDSHDADFGYFRGDGPRFLDALPALHAAGFRLADGYKSNDGDVVEYRLSKDGTHFDFFEHERTAAGIRYRVFGAGREMVSLVPSYNLAPFDFLGRQWQKPEDHAAYLAAIYGDWRIPDPDYDYKTGDLSIVARYAWTGGLIDFTAEGAAAS